MATETLDTLSVYSQIVGLDERRLPAVYEFPKILALPACYLGYFYQARRGTVEDGRERGQSVLWDKSLRRPYYSDMILGSKDRIKSSADVFRAFFGLKAILHYHTHPRNPEDQDPTWHKDFSLMDIILMRALPRLAYISAVGTDLGGVFVFQSDLSARLPISLWEVYLKTGFYIARDMLKEGQAVMEKNNLTHRRDIQGELARDVIMRVTDKIRISRGGNYLQNLGFGCYTWTPENLNENPAEIMLTRL